METQEQVLLTIILKTTVNNIHVGNFQYVKEQISCNILYILFCLNNLFMNINHY